MIKQQPIYVDSSGKHVYVGIPECGNCTNEIEDVVFVSAYYQKHYSFVMLTCQECFNKVKKEYRERSKIYSDSLASVVSTMPQGAKPFVIPPRPETGSSRNTDISVFEPEKIPSNKTVDNTKYAGRESWEGSYIGVTPDLPKKEINEEEVYDYFIEQKEAKPVVPEFISYDGESDK